MDEGLDLWEATLEGSFNVFFKHSDFLPDGKEITANFYKCGDDLTVPHFVSWNPIKTEKPDFHRPEFFGKLKFKDG